MFAGSCKQTTGLFEPAASRASCACVRHMGVSSINGSTTQTRNRARQRLSAWVGTYRRAFGAQGAGHCSRFHRRLLDGRNGRRGVCGWAHRAAGDLGAVSRLETCRRASGPRTARRTDQGRSLAQHVSRPVCRMSVLGITVPVRGGGHRSRDREGALAARGQGFRRRSRFLYRAGIVQARIARRPLPRRRQRGEPHTRFPLSCHGRGGRDRSRSWHS